MDAPEVLRLIGPPSWNSQNLLPRPASPGCTASTRSSAAPCSKSSFDTGTGKVVEADYPPDPGCPDEWHVIRRRAARKIARSTARESRARPLVPGRRGPNERAMLTFQQIILRLQDYWDKQGCALLQPYDMEVGAGTYHTATFLRALGPEPWNAAYVEPTRRPNDGRYGENPNRLQQYYQYQVVLKPAPANILDLYLGSLDALGIDLKQHDVRFVEDDWENPTLGAGAWAGRYGSTAWRSRSSPTSSRSAASTAGRSPARSPTASSASRCTCRTTKACTTSSGRRASATATCTTRTRWSRPRTTSSTPTSRSCCRAFGEYETKPSA